MRKRSFGLCTLIPLLVSVLLGAVPAAAQTTLEWRSWSATGPSPRKGHGMAYDTARKKIVLFGGKSAAGVYLDDTWEFDVVTKTWSQRTSAHAPQARAYFAMTYDPVRVRTVLQGGQQTGDDSAEDYLSPSTWEWDGANWQRISSSSGPRERWHNRMVWDAMEQGSVLFGGANTADEPLSDTWLYKNGIWFKKNPANSPQERMAHAMAYDSVRKRVLLHGGAHVKFGNEPSSQHLFAWVNNAWSLITGGGPQYRSGHAMVFDDHRGVAVIFGGTYETVIYGDTWELNDTAWSYKGDTGTPAPRFNHAMVHDSHNQVVWMFGGEGYSGIIDPLIWSYGPVGETFDLRLYLVRAQPPQIALQGQKININTRLRNVGGKPVASSLTLKIWLSLDQERDGLDTRVCNRVYSFVLNPGQAFSMVPKCRIPLDMPEGEYYLIAQIESAGDTKAANNITISRSKLTVVTK